MNMLWHEILMKYGYGYLFIYLLKCAHVWQCNETEH